MNLLNKTQAKREESVQKCISYYPITLVLSLMCTTAFLQQNTNVFRKKIEMHIMKM